MLSASEIGRCTRRRATTGQPTGFCLSSLLLIELLSRMFAFFGAVIVGAKNLFSAVSEDHVGAVGQIHIRSAALGAAAGECDLVAGLERARVPAELFGEAVL